MSDSRTVRNPPRRKTKKIVLTVMGVAAAGVIGLALLGGDDNEEEMRRNTYATKEDCIADYSAEQCEPQPQQAGSGESRSTGSSMAWIGPAYLAGRMMSGGGFGGQSGFARGAPEMGGAPLPGQTREEQQQSRSGGTSSGGYYRPGAAVNDPGPGRTQGTAAAVPRMSVATVSRGGFGSTGRSFSSSSSS